VAKPRKLRLPISPPVVVDVRGHRVEIDGLTLLRPHVMIEYRIDPPLRTESPFGPHLLIFDVTDDAAPGSPYPTFWHDWHWPTLGPDRYTTRLERRPPATATRLHLVVRPAQSPDADGRRPWTSSLAPLATFEVSLPLEHGLPWGETPSAAPLV
jgi:hypothetical protein